MKRQEMTGQRSLKKIYIRTGENRARQKAYMHVVSKPNADWEMG